MPVVLKWTRRPSPSWARGRSLERFETFRRRRKNWRQKREFNLADSSCRCGAAAAADDGVADANIRKLTRAHDLDTKQRTCSQVEEHVRTSIWLQ